MMSDVHAAAGMLIAFGIVVGVVIGFFIGVWARGGEPPNNSQNHGGRA